MRCGFLSTSWKPCARAVSGSLRRRRGRNKAKQSQKSKSSWSHSSMREGSSTSRSCRRARRLINKSTRRSCGVCFTQCAWRDDSCDRTNRSCFTSIMLMLPTPWVSGSFWPTGTSPCWNNLPIQLRMTFFFPKGDHFWRHGGHQVLPLRNFKFVKCSGLCTRM